MASDNEDVHAYYAALRSASEYVSRAEAARYLGISQRTVDRLIKAGKLKARRLPTLRGRGTVRIPRAALEEVFEKRQTG